MDLNTIVADNLKRVCAEFDISTRDLASRIDGAAGQKSVWNLLNGRHSPTLKTLEPVCKALMISPAALMVPNMPAGLLVSLRLNRMIERYSRMTPTQRDQLEDFLSDTLDD